MKRYQINITSNISEEKLLSGTFIVIFRATKIPPHISLITEGKLFDITTVGPNRDLDALDIFKTLQKRKEEVIFVELENGIEGVNKSAVITEKVNNYWKVDEEVSCLFPIKDFLEEAYQIEVKKSNFIFELLPLLFDLEMIKSVSQVNLDKKIINQCFEMRKYNKHDVENCINALRRKEAVC